jgi:hypothetical protein
MTVYELNQEITFTDQKGQTLTGVVETRNWFYKTLDSYVVRVGAVRYNVCAISLIGGHSF